MLPYRQAAGTGCGLATPAATPGDGYENRRHDGIARCLRYCRTAHRIYLVSFAYILAMLLFLGERRILVLLLVPALFCAIAIYCFDTILATPLPLLFFAGDTS